MVWFKCGQLNLLDYVVYHDINHASEYHDKQKAKLDGKAIIVWISHTTLYAMAWYCRISYHIISYCITTCYTIWHWMHNVSYCTAIGYVILYLEHWQRSEEGAGSEAGYLRVDSRSVHLLFAVANCFWSWVCLMSLSTFPKLQHFQFQVRAQYLACMLQALCDCMFACVWFCKAFGWFYWYWFYGDSKRAVARVILFWIYYITFCHTYYTKLYCIQIFFHFGMEWEDNGPD